MELNEKKKGTDSSKNLDKIEKQNQNRENPNSWTGEGVVVYLFTVHFLSLISVCKYKKNLRQYNGGGELNPLESTCLTKL